MLDAELGDDRVRERHQGLVLERDEVHREAGAHRLAGLRVAEDDLGAVRDSVDRALRAGGELHHEQVGLVVDRRQDLDRLLEAHRDRAGPLAEELVGAIDGRVEDPEAARARGEHRLEADGAVRIAELARGRLDLGCALDAPEIGGGEAQPAQEGVALGLVVRAVDRVGRRDEDGDVAEAPGRAGEPFEVERRLGQHCRCALALGDFADRVRKARVGTGGDEVESVAEVPADRALAHVGADEPDLALAVRAQRVEERCRPGSARRGHDDGERLHSRSIRSARRCSRRAARSASRNVRIVSPIVEPS